jgi:hypothetical protein
MIDTLKIRTLNDSLRKTLVGGRVVATCPVVQSGELGRILQQVRNFDMFDDNNDPHGEHDFGSFKFNDETYLWKIDYYDREMAAGSPDPANPSVTTRVLTVFLASEY